VYLVHESPRLTTVPRACTTEGVVSEQSIRQLKNKPALRRCPGVSTAVRDQYEYYIPIRCTNLLGTCKHLSDLSNLRHVKSVASEDKA
jgi:hypothetical protein